MIVEETFFAVAFLDDIASEKACFTLFKDFQGILL
jgi:hypothetical protein